MTYFLDGLSFLGQLNYFKMRPKLADLGRTYPPKKNREASLPRDVAAAEFKFRQFPQLSVKVLAHCSALSKFYRSKNPALSVSS